MAVLYHRISFTRMVDEALASSSIPQQLKSVSDTLITKRTNAVRAILSQPANKAHRTQLEILITLYKEQLDVISDLLDKTVKWENECRFYVQGDGTVLCKCGKSEITVGAAERTLVVTPLTRKVRRAYLEAYNPENDDPFKILWLHGPPGTGKLEVLKDTARMLGQDFCLFSCSEPGWDISKVMDKLSGVCIFESFDSLSDDDQSNCYRPVAEAGGLMCIVAKTEMPREIARDFGDRIVAMTVPKYETIVQVMLAASGVEACDPLGAAMSSCLSMCKVGCSKQPWYDFGLRFAKTMCDSIARLLEVAIEDAKKNPMNDEGAKLQTGIGRYSSYYYCSRRLGRAAIPGSDGWCGPTNGPQCASCKRFQALFNSGDLPTPSLSHLEKALVCDTVGASLYSSATAADKPGVLAAVSMAFGREPAISAAIPKEWTEATIATLRAKTFKAACKVRHTCIVGLSKDEIDNLTKAREAYAVMREGDVVLAPATTHDGTLIFNDPKHPFPQLLSDIPDDMHDLAVLPIVVPAGVKYSTLEPLCSLLDGNRELVLTDGKTRTLPKCINIVLLASDTSDWQPALLARVAVVRTDFKPVDYKAKFEESEAKFKASETQVAELKAELEALKAKLIDK